MNNRCGPLRSAILRASVTPTNAFAFRSPIILSPQLRRRSLRATSTSSLGPCNTSYECAYRLTKSERERYSGTLGYTCADFRFRDAKSLGKLLFPPRIPFTSGL
jgi:hypothetical protein